MGEITGIEWTHHSFNAWVGCTKVSSACDHCYAEGWAKRTGNAHLWNGQRRRTSESNWRQPLKWNRIAAKLGVRRRVFCCSLADVFDNQADSQWRSDLFNLIDTTPALDWLLLTKRPQNIRKMLPANWHGGWPNVWLGATVENQEEADRRLPHLLSIPAAIHFLSCEPLLGPVRIPTNHTYWYPVDWVIVGGESGAHRRPMNLTWANSIRDQCSASGISFYGKQDDKVRDLPPDLMVRQFPTTS